MKGTYSRTKRLSKTDPSVNNNNGLWKSLCRMICVENIYATGGVFLII